ncbi:hypothetical protein PR048_026282 [Dryococelus australis]|uniref:Uncharacterized protein n=1 Tax=Dryococelus australis TaxID=614101 RepID=A0ABQ9GKW2_9NEOP|nr:hypothetical protein PR048_026282 [Dryococelus australis]
MRPGCVRIQCNVPLATRPCSLPLSRAHVGLEKGKWFVPLVEGDILGCIRALTPPTKAIRVQSPAGSPNFIMWESCRTMPLVGGFSRGSSVSPASSFRRCSILTSVTLIGSQGLLQATSIWTDLLQHSQKEVHGLFSPTFDDLGAASGTSGNWNPAPRPADRFNAAVVGPEIRQLPNWLDILLFVCGRTRSSRGSAIACNLQTSDCTRIAQLWNVVEVRSTSAEFPWFSDKVAARSATRTCFIAISSPSPQFDEELRPGIYFMRSVFLVDRSTPVTVQDFVQLLRQDRWNMARRGTLLVTHWTRIREDSGSIPGPAILISTFHGSPKLLRAKFGRGPKQSPWPIPSPIPRPCAACTVSNDLAVNETNRIRLERASQKHSSDTHKTPYDRVKRCRERKINIKAPERVNVDFPEKSRRPEASSGTMPSCEDPARDSQREANLRTKNTWRWVCPAVVNRLLESASGNTNMVGTFQLDCNSSGVREWCWMDVRQVLLKANYTFNLDSGANIITGDLRRSRRGFHVVRDAVKGCWFFGASVAGVNEDRVPTIDARFQAIGDVPLTKKSPPIDASRRCCTSDYVFLIGFARADQWRKRLRVGRRVGASSGAIYASSFVVLSDVGRTVSMPIVINSPPLERGSRTADMASSSYIATAGPSSMGVVVEKPLLK